MHGQCFDLLFTASTRSILKAIKAAGGEARFVGGCVRDSLCDLVPKDIDFAVNMVPEDVVRAITEFPTSNELQLAQYSWGLKFGTVVVRDVNGNLFEITSLRRDVSCDGRRAIVAYTKDWREDAARRDFTFNAMYVDEHGILYDFFGGAEDLCKGTLHFIGDPGTRIKEDYLRILRVFRFYARFCKTPLSQEVIGACRQHASLLDDLSGERIADEMYKIFALADKLAEVLDIMGSTAILERLFPSANKIDSALQVLCRFVPLHIRYNNDDVRNKYLAVFVRFTGCDRKALVRRWCLSNKIADFLRRACEIPISSELLDMCNKHLFLYGREMCEFALLMGKASDMINITREVLENFYEKSMPTFPVSNADIMATGVSGAGIGTLYATLRNAWLESDCTLSRTDLLALGNFSDR